MTLRNVLLIVTVAACGAPRTPGKPSHDQSCLAYVDEGSDGHGTVVAVREVHNDTCGGDPGVEPVIERLRVTPSGAVEHYDVVTDTWR